MNGQSPGTVLMLIGIAIALVWAMLAATSRLAIAAARWWLYARTRDVEPAVGQVWRTRSGSYQVEVVDVDEDGRVHMTLSPYPAVSGMHITWADSPSEWRERLRLKRMHLVRG